jgi:hypothetical protein
MLLHVFARHSHRFCFWRQTLHTFIFCECFIKWNNGSVRLTIWKQTIGDGLSDEKQNGHLVLLDAKAAFDKVIHSHLFRVFRTKRGLLLKSEGRWWHRFCFRRQTLHTFIFCECFIKWNNGSVRLTIWKQTIGDGLLNTTCAYQSDRVATRSRWTYFKIHQKSPPKK